MMDGSAGYLERGQQLICLGEEFCLPFAGTVYRSAPECSPFLLQSAFIPSFSGSDMVADDQGAETIGIKLLAALAPFRLLSERAEALWRSPSVEDAKWSFAAGLALCPPLLLVFCGEGDLRRQVYPHFAENGDFVLPGDSAPVMAGRQAIPFERVRDHLVGILEPIVRGMRALHAAGLLHSMLAALPPAVASDDAFAAANGYRCPLAIRQKLVLLANRLLAEMSGFVGIPFVAEAQTDIGEIIRAMIDHPALQSDRHNVALYGHAVQMAAVPNFAGTPDYEEAKAEFQAKGLTSRPLDPALIATLVEDMTFDLDVGNRHRNPFWCGNTAKPFQAAMRTFVPDTALLRRVHDIVYSPEILPYIQGCLGCDPYFVNSRFFLSLPHDVGGEGPQAFHCDGCPPGLIRALIYLVDVDEDNGPFEYIDETGQARKALGPAGTLLVFDANRLVHRGSPPRSRSRKAIDFCVAPRCAGMPRRVMWAGMNNWPLDPFQYPVDGMCAYPEFTESWVRVDPLPQR